MAVPWWDRPWVLGEHLWWTIHPAHQHLCQRKRWPRKAVPPLVWSHWRLQYLLHHLEPARDLVSSPLILLKLVVPMPGYKGSFCQFCDLISNYKMACYIKIRGCLQLNYLQVQCLIDLSLVWIHWYRILVNGKPIRQMKNQMRDDTPFPLFQPMRMYASIWNAEEWATQGGRIKTDWSQAPFTAFFRNYTANACVPHNRAWICGQGSGDSSWFNQELDDEGKQKLKEVDDKNKIYDYCTDSRRFPNGYPPECTSQ